MKNLILDKANLSRQKRQKEKKKIITNVKKNCAKTLCCLATIFKNNFSES